MSDAGQRIDATEYVLGLLDPQDKRAFELALLDDPDLANEVWQAEAALAPLGLSIKERQPPARVSRQIEKALFASGGSATRPNRVALAFWRGTASLLGLAAVGAGALAIVLLVRPDAIVTREDPLVAGLVATDGGLTLARVTSDGALRTASFAGSLPEGRVPELWFVDQDGTARSLGLLSTDDDVTLPLPSEADEATAPDGFEGLQLVVTDEPPGGAPQGVATGGVVAEGMLQPI